MFEEGLAELHTHLGGSVASDILWSLAHEQGIALPVKDYWEFDRLVTSPTRAASTRSTRSTQIYHWTELIQSSPLAVERSVHAAIGGAYRSQGITTLELRFNPMKRNRGGERDLDHIIMAAFRGLDRASLEYPQVRAGLILMMDRTFDERQNAIIVEKAIRYAPRGIVGIDIAGPRPRRRALPVPRACAARRGGPRRRARRHDPRRRGGRRARPRPRLGEVVETLRPDRIGHGILAARDPELMARAPRAPGSCSRSARPRTCSRGRSPTRTRCATRSARSSTTACAFTIATDGPEMMRTHLRDELELLERIGALDEDELRRGEPPRPRGELRREASAAYSA